MIGAVLSVQSLKADDTAALPATNKLMAAQVSPVAPVENVTNVYFGTTVVDPYRYLENLSDTNVAAWMKAQNNYTRSMLDQIPGRKPLLLRRPRRIRKPVKIRKPVPRGAWC